MLEMEEVEDLSWCINASVISIHGLSLIEGLEFTDWPVSNAASTLSDKKLSRRCAVVEAAFSSCDEDGDFPGASARLPGKLRRVQKLSSVSCPCSSVVNMATGLSDTGDYWDINLNIEGGAIYSLRSACMMKRIITLSADNWCYDAHFTQLALKFLGS